VCDAVVHTLCAVRVGSAVPLCATTCVIAWDVELPCSYSYSTVPLGVNLVATCSRTYADNPGFVALQSPRFFSFRLALKRVHKLSLVNTRKFNSTHHSVYNQEGHRT
jgi:hypothetical protein